MKTAQEFEQIIDWFNNQTYPMRSLKKWNTPNVYYDNIFNIFLIHDGVTVPVNWVGAFSFCFPEDTEVGQIYILEQHRRKGHGTNFMKNTYLPYMERHFEYLNGLYYMSARDDETISFLKSLGFDDPFRNTMSFEGDEDFGYDPYQKLSTPPPSSITWDD